jgi:hypothetical protein
MGYTSGVINCDSIIRMILDGGREIRNYKINKKGEFYFKSSGEYKE